MSIMNPDTIKQINFEISGKCNLRCPMCPQSTGREKDFLKQFPIDLYKKAIDDALPWGLKFVNLSGSGEPLVSKHLEEAISYASERKLITMLYTNGVLMTVDRFVSLANAGLSICKVSCMGWDRDSYKHWMSVDKFDQVREQLADCINLPAEKKCGTYLQTNHLIHDVENLEFEKTQYIKNWIDFLNVEAEIWMEHNWAGMYKNTERDKLFPNRKKRSCGRPLANIVEVRAGGIGKEFGAVVPCPNVLGQDSQAVQGHLSQDSIVDIYFGDKMERLRQAHVENNYADFDYCASCDQLLDVEESLVWTNIPGRAYGESRISGLKLV